MATIDELERRNAELRSAVERRLAAAAELPPEIASLFPGVTVRPAEPQEPAEFKTTLVSASMPADQLKAAWSAVAAKAQAVRERQEPIKTIRIDARASKPTTRLIGISGRAGSGKNTVASLIPGAAVLQLADPLYAGLAAMLGVAESVLRHRVYKSTLLPGIGQTPRQLLQTLGTEWGRSFVGEDVWINMCERRMEQMAAAGIGVVAIADVRFENEAEWVRGKGGQVWHVYREGVTVDTHASERGVAVHETDRVIDNSGTLDELQRAVESAFAA